ncbi:MAG TPA: TIM-barrel domain-containing protein [Acidimicrobiales bacterium]|nr:TIM-barrel domain-containing protein [Acidimicrobiales bacterium]
MPGGAPRSERWALMRTGAMVVSKLGLPTVGHALMASVRAEWVGRRERAEARMPALGVDPGSLRSVETFGTGARFTFERAELEVALVASDVVRLTWRPGRVLPPYGLADDTGWEPPTAEVRQGDDAWTVEGGVLVVEVALDGAVTIARADGSVLRRQSPPEQAAGGWLARFAARDGESFHGLGLRAARLDLRGGRYHLWNRDPGGGWGPGRDPLYLSIPVLIGRHEDGDVLTFYENTTRGAVRLVGDAVDVSFSGGALRAYVATGDVARLVDRYTALTGRPALPPRWALGYHQSRWGYRDATEISGIVDGFAHRAIPVSVVHLDIDYMDGFRVFTVDGRRFPDLARLAADAARHAVRLVTIIDPGVKVDDRFGLYADGRRAGHFCRDAHGRDAVGVVWPGRAVFPDFTHPATRQWWGSKYGDLLDQGVAGIWHDMNEPATIAVMGDPTLPSSTRHDLEGTGGDHREAHNVYGLLMNRAGYDGQRASRPERRPFIVSRSGWAGTQRYAWNWTGDVASAWDGLRQQVAALVGLGLSGVPFSGSDIGGFSGVAPDDELYLRWLQFAVFTPFCRTHSVVGSPPREPWAFSPEVAGAVGAWIRFRYRLLPYLYTLVHEAARSGAPLMRPLWWPDGGDGAAAPAAPTDGAVSSGHDARHDTVDSDDDSFLLGDALLVAPVTRAGARWRSVSPPAGDWADLWSASELRPADVVRLAAPVDLVPVLVRRGSIVPLDDGWAQSRGPCRLADDRPTDPDDPASVDARLAMDHAPKLLAFHCWANADGSAVGSCVDDAGDGDGPLRRDDLRLRGARPGGEAVVTWERKGAYDSPRRVRVVVHGLVAGRARADGREVEVHGGTIECAPFDELRLLGLSRPEPVTSEPGQVLEQVLDNRKLRRLDR